MTTSIEAIVWYLFLLDSTIAILISLFFTKWAKKNKNNWFIKRFPLTIGWTILYFGLVLWVGTSLYRLGIL